MKESDDGNVRNPDCPSRRLFDLVTARWATLVLVDLDDSPMRWSQLRKRAGGVSDKMLARTLRELEVSGLIRRTVRGTRPIAVEYSITELGQGVTAPLAQLHRWAEQNTRAFVEHRLAQGDEPARPG